MPVRAHRPAGELFSGSRASTRSCSASQLAGGSASNPGLYPPESACGVRKFGFVCKIGGLIKPGSTLPLQAGFDDHAADLIDARA
jgi:hypothetical protein